MWMLLTLLYGVLKGVREIFKKKALEESTVPQVLFFYTLMGMLFLAIETGFLELIEPKSSSVEMLPASVMWLVFVKSLVIFVAWIAGFNAIKKVPISLYGILDLSRVIFSTLIAVTFLNEVLSLNQIFGLLLVSFGLILLKVKKYKEKEEIIPKYIIYAFLSCLLNAVSGNMDKYITKYISAQSLQFWYMLFLLALYAVYILFSKSKFEWKKNMTNIWIIMLSIAFIIADRALFIANADPASRVTVMTLIKQSGCIVTIIAGRVVFKERNIRYKLFCAFIVILGILLAVL